MCKTATEHKLELLKQLSSVLHGTVKPSKFLQTQYILTTKCLWRQSRSSVVTQCCIHELYLQGKSQQPAVDLAKTFERRKCNHREAIPGDECLASVIGIYLNSPMSLLCVTDFGYAHQGDSNRHRYVVATQSQPLRIKLRVIPAVPIVHVNRSVMVLEPPSDTTLRIKEAVCWNHFLVFVVLMRTICLDRRTSTPSNSPRSGSGPSQRQYRTSTAEKESTESTEPAQCQKEEGEAR